jgi:cellulose biosynthesis protein BcsQ
VSRIISVANPTGGTGKTTTARAIAVSAVEYGKRTLLIDMDERSTLTFLHGIENPRHTAVDLLTGKAGLSTAGLSTAERYMFIPASTRNTVLERQPDSTAWTKSFLQAIDQAEFPIDLVVLDLPSSISQATAWGLSVADSIVVPFTESVTALRGAIQVKNLSSKPIHGLAIMQKELTSEFAVELANEIAILDTAIPKGTQVGAGELKKQSALTSAKESAVSQAYREMTYFLLGL